MTYPLPRDRRQQAAWNEQIQTAYESTRRVPPVTANASASSPDLVARLTDLGELHRSGDLSDDEFAAAKARLLAQSDG
jgi:hypothetical protein